jgi:mRNA-degrading endonuclease RelE of RelBE toxin-antitoxin system
VAGLCSLQRQADACLKAARFARHEALGTASEWQSLVSMKLQIIWTPSASEDLRHFRVYEQRAIVDAVLNYLGTDANAENRRRRKLRPNPLAPWELRIGHYRVFYEIENMSFVKVVAVGQKEHNSLLIRGRIVEL